MDELEDARARFKAVSEGRYAPKMLSVADAKKRLQAVDPGLDISGFLKALRQQNGQKAAASIALETLTDPSVIAYWSPLLTGLVQALMPAASPKADEKSEKGPDLS